jgi:hypothetical protein
MGKDWNGTWVPGLSGVNREKRKKRRASDERADGLFARERCRSIRGCTHGKAEKTGKTQERQLRFFRRFERTYGAGAIARFRRIVEDPDGSLSDAGRHFGFSRENARQVYKKIYGRPYTQVHLQKARERRKRRVEEKKRASLRLQTLLAIRKRLESMHMDAKMVYRGNAFQVLADGCLLGLRLSVRHFMVGGKRYCRFNISRSLAGNDWDFYICVFRSKKGPIHYIIPSEFMPKSGFSVALDAAEGESKYTAYKEAWHLVKNKAQRARSSRLMRPGRINTYSNLAHPNPVTQDIHNSIVDRFSRSAGQCVAAEALRD